MPGLAEHGIARLRAENPSPYTLDGTNTWVIGRDPAWVVSPGPALEAHLDAVTAEVEGRGGAGGIALTHDHEDHVEGVAALRERLPPARRAAAPPPPRGASGRPGPPWRRPVSPPTSRSPTATCSGRCARWPSPATPTTTSRSWP